MKKFLFIALTIIVAAFVAIYLRNQNSSTLNKKDIAFHLQNIDEVDGIEIVSGGQRIELLRNNGNWELNGKAADTKRVNNLLIIAKRLKAISPAAKSNLAELKTCVNNGIGVSYYSGKKLINAYRFCNQGMIFFASLLKSDKLFQVEAQGYPNLDLNRIFSPDITYWTNLNSINYNADEIQSIIIEYPKNTKNSFVLSVDSPGRYSLQSNFTGNTIDSLDSDLIELYLRFFSTLPYTMLSEKEISEISLPEEPFFILSVESDRQSNLLLKAYRKINPENGEMDQKEFYGDIQEKGLVKLNYTDLDPILLKRKDFLKK